MQPRILRLAALGLALLASPAAARTWVVAPDGTGDAPTVQAAIDSASHGDVVSLEPGTYYENVDLRGKRIRLTSRLGPESTILDGSQDDGPVVTCQSGETNATVIENLTIQNGKGGIRGLNGRRGAGMLLLGGLPTVRGNIIRNNRAVTPPGGSQSRGGGVLVYTLDSPGRFVIENNRFEDNFATSLGGALITGGPGLIRGNTFSRNVTEKGDGGAIYLSGAAVEVSDNRFVENIAGDHGGAIAVINNGAFRVPGHDINIHDNLFIANRSNTRIAINCSGAAAWIISAAWFHHNTVAFNHSDNVNPPAASGICLQDGDDDLLIEYNVFYRNGEGALVTFAYQDATVRGTVRRNLIYGNGPDDIIQDGFPDLESALNLIDNLYADPIFCVIGPESRGELAGVSPALNQPDGVIGAVRDPGCPPFFVVPVQPTSWGRIKARFSSGSP